jgi:excisionase family DNA binding protein
MQRGALVPEALQYNKVKNPLFTVDDVADLLQYQPETIRQMARDGRLPARKVGKAWRFDPHEIETWIHSQDPVSSPDVEQDDHVEELALPLPGLEPQRSNGAAFKDPAFTENRGEPVHRWVPWIAGFSSGFVADCLAEYLSEKDPETTLVLDPFAGVGTTLVEATRHGYNTAGFEINPWAALACRAKLEAIDVSVPSLEQWTRTFSFYMREFMDGSGPDADVEPEGFRSRIPFFSPSIRRQVRWALRFIDLTGDPKLRDLFLVAFGSVMVRFSNYSYEPSLASRPGSGKPLIESADVTSTVVAKLQEMIQDCRYIQDCPEVSAGTRVRQVFQASIFDARQHLSSNSVDLAVTSPPYLNNYHYIRNTRPHLFWLKFIEDTTGLKEIEHASFGKFWQTVRAGEQIPLQFVMPELEKLLGSLSRTNAEKGVYGGQGWANYAAQYFNDTNRFCKVMADLMKPEGRLVVVIGNSILQGHELRVDYFLSRVAALHGLETEARHVLRTKRVGNSIIRSSVRNDAGEQASLYEVSVVLRKVS